MSAHIQRNTDVNQAYIRQYVANLKPSFWGKFAYYCLPFRKTVVLNNLNWVFGEVLSPQDIKKLAQSFYSHVMRSLAENIAMSFMSPQQIKDKAVIVNHEIPLSLMKQHRGIAFLTGHFGNWEFAPIAGILNFQEFQGRFHFIRKKQIKIIEQIFFGRFNKAGLQVIPKKNSLTQICDALANNDAIVFVLDQHARIQNKEGIAVEFFGKKAGTYRTLATIVKYTEAPVVPVTCYRRADGKHVMEFFDPIPWHSSENSQEELYLNTKAYNEALEKMILAHPEQWLWFYKRWKLKN